MPFNTKILDASNPAAIDVAASALREGQLVAFPTETVYGLGAIATSSIAVAKIFEAKQRPTFDPLIVHIAERAQLSDVVTHLPPLAMALADAFWPGPLTLVLPRRTSCRVDLLAGAGLDTLAVRVPARTRGLFIRIGTAASLPAAAALLPSLRPPAFPAEHHFHTAMEPHGKQEGEQALAHWHD